MEVDDDDRLSAYAGLHIHRIVLRRWCGKAEGFQGLERMVPVEAGLEGLVGASSRVDVVAVYDGSSGHRRPESRFGVCFLAVHFALTLQALVVAIAVRDLLIFPTVLFNRWRFGHRCGYRRR